MSLISVNTPDCRAQIANIGAGIDELNKSLKNSTREIRKRLDHLNDDFDVLIGRMPKEALMARDLNEEYLERARSTYDEEESHESMVKAREYWYIYRNLDFDYKEECVKKYLNSKGMSYDEYKLRRTKR